MDTPALFPDYHDYDRRERLLTAMVKDFPPGHYTGRHEHPSGQLIYDVHGVMVADTDMGRWVVPPTRWLWMPPSVHHGLRMVGERHAPAAGRAAATAYAAAAPAPPHPSSPPGGMRCDRRRARRQNHRTGVGGSPWRRRQDPASPFLAGNRHDVRAMATAGAPDGGAGTPGHRRESPRCRAGAGLREPQRILDDVQAAVRYPPSAFFDQA